MRALNSILFTIFIQFIIFLPTVQALTCSDATLLVSNPDSVYNINGDGTVTDKRNGLMWKQCAEGQNSPSCSGSEISYSWEDALGASVNSTFAGYGDWRLPNIKELNSLVERCRVSPTINSSVFPLTASRIFWSSTPVIGYINIFNYIDFDSGSQSYYPFTPSGVRLVRLVRGGDSFISFEITPTVTQAITFGAAPTLSVGGTGTVSATASSGLAVTFSSKTPSVCSVSGSTVTGVAAGTCIIAANQYGNETFKIAPEAALSFDVVQLYNTVTVDSSEAWKVIIEASPQIYSGTTPYRKTDIYTGTIIVLTAPPTAGNLTFAKWTGCSVAKGLICTLIVNSSTTVMAVYGYSLLQTITFGTAPTLSVGRTGTVSATASSGLAVTFSSKTPAICTVSGSTVTGIAAGTCTIAANQAGNNSYSAALGVTQTFSVTSRGAILPPSPPNILSIVAGKSNAIINLSPPTSNGGSEIVAYSTTCSADGQLSKTVTGAGFTFTVRGLKGDVSYSCTATASNASFTSSASTAMTVTPLPGGISITPMLMLLLFDESQLILQTITFGTVPSLIVGVSRSLSGAASSGLAVTFSSKTPDICTFSGEIVTGVAAGTCTIAANQAGNSIYSAASEVMQNIAITSAPIVLAQTITFGTAPTLSVGRTVVVSAVSSSGLAVTFSSKTPAICTVSGGIVTGVAAGTCTIAANQAGNSIYSAASEMIQTLAVTSAPVVLANFTKIANNGSALPDSATQWACVLDNTNGLVWEVKTADGGLRDMNHTYTNYDNASSPQKGTDSNSVNPTQSEIDASSNSIGFANFVSGSVLCGYRDWRMPKENELKALQDSSYSPKIDPLFFPNTPSSIFWSGSLSSIADFSYMAATVGFGTIFAREAASRNGMKHIRLVRGG